MTKSKGDTKSKSKRIISTSAIFRHVKPRRSEEGKTSHGYSKRKRVKKAPKNVSKHKYKRELEHPLAVAVTGYFPQASSQRMLFLVDTIPLANVVKSRDHLQKQAEDSINSTYRDLTQRITSSNRHFTNSLQSIKSTTDGLQRSLGKDELRFVSNDGKSASTQLLGDRMKRFQKAIATEEKGIEVLRKQWTDVQQKILDLALEVLPPEGIKCLLTAGSEDVAGYISLEQKSMLEELEISMERWEDEIATVNQRSISELKSGEAVF